MQSPSPVGCSNGGLSLVRLLRVDVNKPRIVSRKLDFYEDMNIYRVTLGVVKWFTVYNSAENESEQVQVCEAGIVI